MKLLPLILFLAVAGCPLDPCAPTETRCTRTQAEICGSDGVWRVLMDCNAEGMRCCWIAQDLDAGVPSGHTCLPTCPAVPDGGE